MMPRFSEENFHKNVVLAGSIKAIADKYKSTPSQVTLAWILAESPNCELLLLLKLVDGGAEL